METHVLLPVSMRGLLAGGERRSCLFLLTGSAPKVSLWAGSGVAGLFSVDRMDTWVLKVSIAIPVVALAGLVLWNLVSWLAGKLVKKRRKFRPALEPRPPLFSPKHPATDFAPAASTPGQAGTLDAHGERIRRARDLLALVEEHFRNQHFRDCLERCKELAGSFSDLPEAAQAEQVAAHIKNDPERLQQACSMLVDSLAEMYLELAESWQRQGQPEQAATALQNLVRTCPGTRRARLAEDRLRKLDEELHSTG
jgi:hypothetical protein